MSSKNYLSIYAKSFNWAGFFLPKKTYKNCSYLYDFCRVVDNIADDEGEIEIKKVKFQKFVSDFKQKILRILLFKICGILFMNSIFLWK